MLIDEAQDFTHEQINEILAYFPSLKSVHFFGDDGQQIYEGMNQKARVSMTELEKIASKYGSKKVFSVKLEDNYRLPRPIAEFVDQVGSGSRLANKSHGQGTEKARLLHYATTEQAVEMCANIIKVRRQGLSHYLAAVIVRKAEACEERYVSLCSQLGRGSVWRVRGAIGENWRTYGDPEGPKTVETQKGFTAIATTAFSSKGMQYDDVFVLTKDFGTQWTENLLNQLHVALTRTQGNLFVMYVSDENMGQPPAPFLDVSEDVYKTSL